MNNSDIAAIHAANDTLTSINEWMKDYPLIEDGETARAAKLLLDRGVLALKDMEDERRSKTDPLRAEIDVLTEPYRAPRDTLINLTEHLAQRLNNFVRMETAKREKEAREARELAEQKELEAREAEAREKEGLDNADAGELDVNVADLIQKADAAFGEYKAAERAANLAERETNVRIGGGFRRAIGLKKKTVLVLTDIVEFLDECGTVPEEVEAAALKAARAFRRINKRLPKGVEEREE